MAIQRQVGPARAIAVAALFQMQRHVKEAVGGQLQLLRHRCRRVGGFGKHVGEQGC